MARSFAKLVACALLASGCPHKDPASAPVPTLRYTVDASRTSGGVVRVELVAEHLPKGQTWFQSGAPSRETAIEELKAVGADGRELALRTREGREGLELMVPVAGNERLTIRWLARPGGMASKHGRQGYVCGRFVLIDGGAFFVPRSAFVEERRRRGRSSLAPRVRVTVKAPAGWQTVSTMKASGDGLDPSVGGAWSLAHLLHVNIALGRFETFERELGSTRVRVAVHQGMPAARRKATAARAFTIYQRFFEQAPCPQLPRYSVIFVPPSDRAEVVSGDFWSTGQAFSIEAYGRKQRPWELLAHRISHAVNKYPICGLELAQRDDFWFVEGWSSWAEVTHLLAAGVVRTEQRLITLGNRYRTVAIGKNPRVRDAALVDDHKGPEATTQYLHYTKAPLVVQMLDRELRRRSGGKKSVNRFVAEIYPRYRAQARPFSLQAELERYAGKWVGGFFDAQVRKLGWVYPLNDGFIAHVAKQQPSEADRRVVLRVDGIDVSAGQQRRLERFVRNIGVGDPARVEQLAIEMALVQAEYRRRGASGVPQEMLRLWPSLPASVRYLMWKHQRALLFDDDAAYKRWLAGRRQRQLVKRL